MRRRKFAPRGSDVVKFGVFVTEMSVLPVVREIPDRHVDRARAPARTAVHLAAQFRLGYLVEIDALAVVQDTPTNVSAQASRPVTPGCSY